MNTVWVDSGNAHKLNDHKRMSEASHCPKLTNRKEK